MWFMALLVCAAAPADLLVQHAHVLRLGGKELPGAETSVAVVAGRIVFVGDDTEATAWRGPRTQVFDARGMTLMPGFVDAHAHLQSLGASLDTVDLRGAASVDEAVRRVRIRAASSEKGAWILGRGWDQNLWPGQKMPTAAALSAAVPDHRVLLHRVDGHAVWLNQQALAAAGITSKSRDPSGGRIERDAKGQPTGVLLDNAIGLAEHVVPQPSAPEIEAHLLRAQDEVRRLGIVSVHDMGVSQTTLDVYRKLERDKKLRIRAYVALEGSDDELLRRELPKRPQLGAFLTVRTVKLYLDGALGSRGALLLDDYSDQAANRGLQLTSDEALRDKLALARRHGFQVAIHAIGDRANRLALTALEAGKPEERHRVEHAQVVPPDDWSRFAKAGILASMQPTHATSDMPWAEARLGPRRIAGAYAWNSLQAAGARLVFGSDFPVEAPDPLAGVFAAVTRQDARLQPVGGWTPGERLSRVQALAAFTEGGRFAAFQEQDAGRIEVGQAADFIVVSRDLLRCPEHLLSEATWLAAATKRGCLPRDEALPTYVRATVVDGVLDAVPAPAPVVNLPACQ